MATQPELGAMAPATCYATVGILDDGLVIWEKVFYRAIDSARSLSYLPSHLRQTNSCIVLEILFQLLRRIPKVLILAVHAVYLLLVTGCDRL